MEPGFWARFMTELRTPGSFWRDRTLICLAVVLSYASVWPNKFLFDDVVLIQANDFFKMPAGLFKILTHRNGAGAGLVQGFYRPVPMAVHFFIYRLSYPLCNAHMPMTVGFHALNIALQALNGCLLLAFGVRAGFNRNAALAAALLWAVHPLHTEAVTYMASTPELMWSTFCLLGLVTLLPKAAPMNGIVDQQDAFSPRRTRLSLVLFTLALLSKESAIVFPALATATLFFISEQRRRLSTYFKTDLLWLLSFAYILIILLFILQPAPGTLNQAYTHIYRSSIAVRLWTALATLPTYAHLIIWPQGLHFRRVFPVFTTLWHSQPLLGLAMVLAAALQILWGRGRRGLALTFGLLWFAAAQSPNTGIVAPIDALISEHWMYLPTMGLFLGVTQTFAGLFRNRQKAAILLVAVMTVALGTATFRQNMEWRNINTLYQNTKRNGGSLILMNGHEAVYLMAHRRFADARRLLQNSIDALPKGLSGDQAVLHKLMSFAWLGIVPKNGWEFTVETLRSALPATRHMDEAIAELQKSARINPAHSYWQHKFLAVIYAYQGDRQKAAEQQKIAKQLKPEDQ